MEGIDKIAAKIAQDAQADAAKLAAETEEKAQAVLADARAQAQEEGNQIAERGRMAAAERLERLSSATQMERRKLELAAKQEVLGEAFELALEMLCSLPEKEYIDLLTKLALEASSTGREQMIFSQKDRARVGKQVVIAANEALSKGHPAEPAEGSKSKVGALLGKVVRGGGSGAAGMLTLSEETRDIRGGFIMVDGDVEINCAFETLVRLQREQMEKKVADVLFA